MRSDYAVRRALRCGGMMQYDVRNDVQHDDAMLRCSMTMQYDDAVRRCSTTMQYVVRYDNTVRRCSTTCGATMRRDDACPIYNSMNYVAHMEANCMLSDTICVQHIQIPLEPRTEPNELIFR